MKHLKFILLFLITANLKAQIDTTVWYPMHIGDKWEYYSSVSGYRTVSIIGDTLMPNGHTYFILTLGDRKYQRVDSNKYVMVYNEYVESGEYTRFDLLANRGVIVISPVNDVSGFGVYRNGIDNNNLLQINLEWKEYRDVYIDTSSSPPDTIWNTTVDLYWPRITKGLGVSSYSYGLDVLVGLEINGVGYGTLVDVDEDINIVNDFELHQNYPNPFNPNTNIRYVIADTRYETRNVRLSVSNLLGQNVAVLVDKEQKPGNYDVTFDAGSLPSGTYFIQLVSGNYRQVIKAQLIK